MSIEKLFIKKKLPILSQQGKMDLILDHIVEVRFKDGMNDIRTQFKSMEQAPCKRVWAGEFYGNAAHFVSYRKYFDAKNLQSLFKHEYETKECLYTV